MGATKSKHVVYTTKVPDSEEREYSAILRHPDAQNIDLVPKI